MRLQRSQLRTILENEKKILQLFAKHHSFQSGKEHVGTETIVHCKSAIQSAIIQVMKKLYDCSLFQEKDLMLKRYFRLRSEGQERLRFVYTVTILRGN
jgi:hypothetical protein